MTNERFIQFLGLSEQFEFLPIIVLNPIILILNIKNKIFHVWNTALKVLLVLGAIIDSLPAIKTKFFSRAFSRARMGLARRPMGYGRLTFKLVALYFS